jgi:DNA-binding PadR family transcriptional regulator
MFCLCTGLCCIKIEDNSVIGEEGADPMSSIRYAILSLLARESLSGYDIKQHMNNRLGPFWKVGSNQVYPELSKLENEGRVRLQGVEQLSYRPAKKLYEITDAGKEELISWTSSLTELEHSIRDEFFLKTYNSWLIEPAIRRQQLELVRDQHEERLEQYLQQRSKLQRLATDGADDPLLATVSVIEFGIRYETQYIEWCNELIEKLSPEKYRSGQGRK